MTDRVTQVVIVGGGSAGWLSAGIIAASSPEFVQVTLIESPDITPIGVGEGTWPTMRASLQTMGISEADFFRECDASFKQGSKFSRWTSLSKEDDYYHPFTVPAKYHEINLAPFWLPFKDKIPFANAVCPQAVICELGCAPKQITTPEFSAVLNYGYHLDAGKFAAFLHKHCVEKLGVNYISAKVTTIYSHENGDIKSVATDRMGDIAGDLFIDCTGMSSMLLGKHYGVPLVSQKQVLFNDSALAVQIPYTEGADAIVSHTLSTAQSAGWIWDIGLQSRRGIGHVFSSRYTTDDIAERELRNYITPAVGEKMAEELAVRKIAFNPGHRKTFWHKNCVAIGLSAGFIEPLEATALVLIESSAKMIAEQFPVNRTVMDTLAKRFNNTLNHHWVQIINFLKLHYVLTKRTDTEYWRDNCLANSIPENLAELLALWKVQSPWLQDEVLREEMFPSASYQYIYYGMKATTVTTAADESNLQKIMQVKKRKKAEYIFVENAQHVQQLKKLLQPNRELIEKIKQYGLQAI
ncbi:tryptophan halogenase family protein [Cellvibrio sp. NN19]|uniref:tryptophan halogenase family protein n=1 Tax=Cellvibrio chitinivorans TaxID=3102792 RepID=UPI002B401090|nr:tryptophan halogenase family protein [Cellvibrio sp. NN19]